MNIYEKCHGSQEDFIPVSELHDKEIENVIKYYNMDINNFYKVLGRIFKYCYMRDYVFVEIYDMSIQGFEALKVKDIIEFREKYLKEALDKKDYERFFSMIDKPRRLHWFSRLCDDMELNEAKLMFKDIYSSIEYGFSVISKDMIKKYLYNDDLDRSQFEEIVTIYRGEASKSNTYDKAYSWTTDIKIAEFFANRFNTNDKRIYEAKIKREDIIDYIENRNESEVILIPDNLINVKRLL